MEFRREVVRIVPDGTSASAKLFEYSIFSIKTSIKNLKLHYFLNFAKKSCKNIFKAKYFGERKEGLITFQILRCGGSREFLIF